MVPPAATRSESARNAGLSSARTRRPARRAAGMAARTASAIELIHRAVHVAQRDLRRLGRAVEGLLRDGLLVLVERREHVLGEIGHLAQLGRCDTDPDAGE